MNYSIQPGIWRSVFAVPTDIVDKHIKMCSPLSIKVLLILLRHGDKALDVSQLSSMLNLSGADIQDALNYWLGVGLIQAEDGSFASPVSPSSLPSLPLQTPPQLIPVSSGVPAKTAESTSVTVTIEETGQKLTTMTNRRQKLTQADINELSRKDDTISYLIQEAQLVLGDTFNKPYSEMLVALYSYYSMQPDVILMVLHYCMSVGKKSIAYVEKTAVNWLELGIDTHEKAEKHINELANQNTHYSKIKQAFQIQTEFSSNQKETVSRWFDEYGFDMNMITIAYERMIDSTGKLNFNYMDKILSSWHQNKISTPKQAIEEQVNFSNRNKLEKTVTTPSYNGSYTQNRSYAQSSYTQNPHRGNYDNAHEVLQQRRQNAVTVAQAHKDELYDKIPELAQIERDLSQTGVQVARAVMSGGDKVPALIQNLQSQNIELQKRRVELLKQVGCPPDYLSVQYCCKTCEDTGYINDKMCTCLRQLIHSGA